MHLRRILTTRLLLARNSGGRLCCTFKSTQILRKWSVGELTPETIMNILSFQCLHTTWYISVDWQMTALVAPALIYLLWKFYRVTEALIEILIISSSMYGMKVCYDLQISIENQPRLNLPTTHEHDSCSGTIS